MTVFFWVSAWCSGSLFWYFRGTYCLHLQGDWIKWTLQWYREESVTSKVKAVHYLKTSECLATKQCQKPEDKLHNFVLFSTGDTDTWAAGSTNSYCLRSWH